MSDITRDDLRRTIRELNPSWTLSEEPHDGLTEDGLTADTVEAMALDWIAENPGKVLRALLTDECETCEGHGGQMHVHTVAVLDHDPGCNGVTCESTCPVPVPMPVEEWEQCTVCEGRGWLLNGTALGLPDWLSGVSPFSVEKALVDWLEAEDEQ